MTAIKGTTVKTEFKSICDRAYKGESFIVTRPRNENVVLLSEREYRQLLRIKAYAERMSDMAGKSNIDAVDTYPQGFFELFGSGSKLGFDEEPEELNFDLDGARIEL